MARPSNTEQRKTEIVRALLKVMADKGYEKASIQSIAKAADLTPGLIHYHFKTKQDILLALVEWIVTLANERWERYSEGLTQPWDKLRAFINARLATGQDAMPDIVSAWVVIAGESVRQREVKALYERLIESQLSTLRSLIAEVSPGKSPDDKEVVEFSAIVVSAMEGAFHLSATADEVMPKDYAAPTILRMIEAFVENS